MLVRLALKRPGPTLSFVFWIFTKWHYSAGKPLHCPQKVKTYSKLRAQTPKTATANGRDINRHVRDCATLTEASIAGFEPFPDRPVALWDLVPPGTQVKVPEHAIGSFMPRPDLPNDTARQEPPATEASTRAMSVQEAWRYAKPAALASGGANFARRVHQRKGGGVPLVRGAPGGNFFAFRSRRRF